MNKLKPDHSCDQKLKPVHFLPLSFHCIFFSLKGLNGILFSVDLHVCDSESYNVKIHMNVYVIHHSFSLVI